jgi:folate-binding protein YgfZ
MFSHAGYRVLTQGAGWLQRVERGRLRLTGADRRSYLQGILTNDIASLTPGTGCYAAMLTPQGRMLADMRVLELGDALLIDLGRSATPDIRERFDRFIFSEDVVVADESDNLVQLGIYGPRAGSVLTEALSRLSSDDAARAAASALGRLGLFHNTNWRSERVSLVAAGSDDFGIEGFELFIESGGADAVTRALLAAGAVQVDHATADVCRIEAGRPLFGVDMDEHTIPLEAGIEDRAISLTKGCYVGQEIIIRVLHRGHGRVARRLTGLLVDGAVPSRADRIRAGEREVGVVTSGAESPSLGRPIALGYVHSEHTEPGVQLTIVHGDRTLAATVATLPFVHRQAEPARP